MPNLSRLDADAVLLQLFGKELYIGLARDDPSDEEIDPGYRRKSIRLSAPQGDDVRFVTNTEPILFPEYRKDASKEVRFVFLADSMEGGIQRWSEELDKPQKLGAGSILFFATGKFKIGVQ